MTLASHAHSHAQYMPASLPLDVRQGARQQAAASPITRRTITCCKPCAACSSQLPLWSLRQTALFGSSWRHSAQHFRVLVQAAWLGSSRHILLSSACAHAAAVRLSADCTPCSGLLLLPESASVNVLERSESLQLRHGWDPLAMHFRSPFCTLTCFSLLQVDQAVRCGRRWQLRSPQIWKLCSSPVQSEPGGLVTL